jgi:hypothetical protein
MHVGCNFFLVSGHNLMVAQHVLVNIDLRILWRSLESRGLEYRHKHTPDENAYM